MEVNAMANVTITLEAHVLDVRRGLANSVTVPGHNGP